MLWLLIACTSSVDLPATATDTVSDTVSDTGAEGPVPLAWEGCTSAYEVGSLPDLDSPMVSVPTVVGELGYFGATDAQGVKRIVRATVQEGRFLDPLVALTGPTPVGLPINPMLLEEADGSWSLFLGGQASGGSGTWRCVGEDGREWTDCELVLGAGHHGEYDAMTAILPHVLWMGDHYRLWYTGMSEDHTWRILTATSEDGWSFGEATVAVPLGSEGSWDDTSTYSPFVWEDQGVYRMLYAGRAQHEGYQVKRLIEAWSPDGITWQDFTPSLDLGCAGDADAWRLDAPWVVPEGDGWRLYYDGFDDPITTDGHRTLLTATAD